MSFVTPTVGRVRKLPGSHVGFQHVATSGGAFPESELAREYLNTIQRFDATFFISAKRGVEIDEASKPEEGVLGPVTSRR